MKKLLLLLLLLPIGFSAAELDITSAEFNNLYSNSLTEIVFNVENIGDETATIVHNNLTFPYYTVTYSPLTINAGDSAQIIFEVSTSCEPRGNSYNFFTNITYSDSSGNYIANSTMQTIIVSSPINLTILSPTDIDSIVGIQTDDVSNLQYFVSNPSKSELEFNMTVSYDDSVFSKVLTSEREFSVIEIADEDFILQPTESYLFSHSLIPVRSGGTGSYTVFIDDESCDYNRQIINVDFQILSESGGLLNIIVADEFNFVLVGGFLIFLLAYRQKIIL